MSTRRRVKVVATSTLLLVSLSAAAWAFWTALGFGSGSAAAGSLAAPTGVTVPSNSGSTVHVSWTAPTPPGSGAVSYYVQRYVGTTSSAACGTSPSSLITATSCNDSGVAPGTYTYKVTALWRTWTAQSAASGSVAVQNDTTPPTSSITFPTSGGSFNSAGYAAGCSTPSTDDICGTASDVGTGVNKVQVSIQRSSDSYYWNGSSWVSSISWNDAIGIATWTYPFAAANLLSGVSYTVQSQAIDNASNTQITPDSKSFTYDTSAPSVLSIDRAAATPTNAGSVSWTVTFSESVSGVDTADFALANTGLTTPAISTVTGGPSVYTVSATTGTGDGTLGLNLNDNDTIIDPAGNKLGGTGTGTVGSGGTGNGSFAGQTYTIDKTGPVAFSVDTTSDGATPGRPDNPDKIIFTFSEAMKPSSIKLGWNGSSTTVSVVITSGSTDILSVTGVNLGTITLGTGNWATADITWSDSTMSLSADGKTLTVTIGATCTASSSSCTSKLNTITANQTFTWNPSATATDLAGNSMVTTAKNSPTKQQF